MSLVQGISSILQNVQNARTYVDNLSNRIFVAPKNTQGIAGFIFEYEGDSDVLMQTEITDHWNESNSAIQDHIAVKPSRVTLKGMVSERVSISPKSSGFQGALSTLQNKLTQVPSYLGKYTPQAQQQLLATISQAQSIEIQLAQGLARAESLVKLFPSAPPSITEQQKAYSQLSALLLTQQLFVVVTPFEVFDNMAIESLHSLQPGDTKFWSEFTVVMKQIRTTDVQSIPNFLARYGGRASLMNQGPIDKGRTTGTLTPMAQLTSELGG